MRRRTRASSYVHFGIRQFPREEAPFFWVSKRFVMDYMQELSNVAVAVYVVLAWAEHYKTRTINLSYKSLAYFTGFSRDYVIKGIEKLIQRNLILANRSTDGKTKNQYQLLSLRNPSLSGANEKPIPNIRRDPTEEAPFCWFSSYFVTDGYLKDIARSGITLRSFLWLACIENGKNHKSRVAQKRLAEKIGVSSRSVRRAVKKLNELRIIVTFKYFVPGWCNEYGILALKAPQDVPEDYYRPLPPYMKPKKKQERPRNQKTQMEGSRNHVPPNIGIFNTRPAAALRGRFRRQVDKLPASYLFFCCDGAGFPLPIATVCIFTPYFFDCDQVQNLYSRSWGYQFCSGLLSLDLCQLQQVLPLPGSYSREEQTTLQTSILRLEVLCLSRPQVTGQKTD